MNHKDLINRISQTTLANKTITENTLSVLTEVATEQLKQTGQFTLHGVGTFHVVDSAARKGRNPATGQEIAIPAGKRIKFKAAKALKDAVV